MATSPESPIRSSAHEAVNDFNLDTSTVSAVYSLIDAVDSEPIADKSDINTFSKTHDFENLIKILYERVLIHRIRYPNSKKQSHRCCNELVTKHRPNEEFAAIRSRSAQTTDRVEKTAWQLEKYGSEKAAGYLYG